MGEHAWLDHINAKKYTKEQATLLYSELKYSYENFNLILHANKSKDSVQVLTKPHTKTEINFLTSMLKLKNEMSEEDFNAIYTFYNNIVLLESIREDYWKIKNQNEILKKEKEYTTALHSIDKSNTSLDMTNVIQKVKSLSE